jgi:hypothetical protein
MAERYDELNSYLEKLGIPERSYAGMPTWAFVNLMLAVTLEIARREVERDERQPKVS